jgi:Na+:H+ antiporter, NhaA family
MTPPPPSLRPPSISQRLVYGPVNLFVSLAEKGGLLLVFALLLALAWQNGRAGASYEELWSTPIGFDIGTFGFRMPLLLWINEVAMAVFFLVVGAEIKLQVVSGELSGGWRKASLPVVAAFFGMLVPAIVFVAVAGKQYARGFGIPTATDIAFSVAVLSTLGARIPPFIRAFLLGLAIIDDLGAVVVIAVFYGGEIDVEMLGAAGGLIALLWFLNYVEMRRVLVYVILGIPLWILFYKGGIHPTLAGVVVAMAIPAASHSTLQRVGKRASDLAVFVRAVSTDDDPSNDIDGEAAFRELGRVVEEHVSPLERVKVILEHWVTWLILPVFALANGGLDFKMLQWSSLREPVALGAMLGLFMGKQVGVFTTVYTCVKTEFIKLPAGVTMRHVWGASVLAGIGFTMSLFVNGLAFDPRLAEFGDAKVGILVGSFLSALMGYVILRTAPQQDGTGHG